MHRFDALSKSLSSRLSRRTLMKTASGAAAGTTLAALTAPHLSAQQATPVASPVGTAPEKTEFLFVQSAASATLKAETDTTYRLAMQGHTGGTIYFSDRPERIFGEAPTPVFLENLGFSPDNPPNAAIVTNSPDGTSDVLVVELTDPTYDATAGELTYGVTVLEDYESDGLSFAAAAQQDKMLPEELGSTSLFIDDCPDANAACMLNDICPYVDMNITSDNAGRGTTGPVTLAGPRKNLTSNAMTRFPNAMETASLTSMPVVPRPGRCGPSYTGQRAVGECVAGLARLTPSAHPPEAPSCTSVG